MDEWPDHIDMAASKQWGKTDWNRVMDRACKKSGDADVSVAGRCCTLFWGKKDGLKEEESFGVAFLQNCWVTLVTLKPNWASLRVEGKVFLMSLICCVWVASSSPPPCITFQPLAVFLQLTFSKPLAVSLSSPPTPTPPRTQTRHPSHLNVIFVHLATGTPPR